MQSTSPPANFIDAFANGLGQALAPGLEAVAYLILGVLIASPALATMILLWLEPRVALLRRHNIAAGVAGILLTIMSAYVVAWSTVVLGAAIAPGNRIAQWLLPVAIVLAAAALARQWLARNSFTATRATGIACAALTPLTLIALEAMF
jgi:hypothetical protein